MLPVSYARSVRFIARGFLPLVPSARVPPSPDSGTSLASTARIVEHLPGYPLGTEHLVESGADGVEFQSFGPG